MNKAIKMTKFLITSEESGRSMVEMLGVLAIVGVLSIGGIAGYSKAMAKYKINKTLDQLSLIITNVRTAFGNQPSYYGLSTENAITYELVGTDLTLGTADKLTNAYNGNVEIEAICEAGGGDDDYCPEFTITYEGIEKIACGTIASSDWGGSAASGLVSIEINDSKHEWGGANAASKLPIDYVTAMSQCDSDADNILVWTYN